MHSLRQAESGSAGLHTTDASVMAAFMDAMVGAPGVLERVLIPAEMRVAEALCPTDQGRIQVWDEVGCPRRGRLSTISVPVRIATCTIFAMCAIALSLNFVVSICSPYFCKAGTQ